MIFLRVIAPGFLSSVQDLGRKGFAGSGVSEAGAADARSLRLGNLLVGNPPGAAGLEMTLVGGAFEVLSDCHIAITGSDLQPNLDSHRIPMWQAQLLRAGQVLSFGATQTGARCYLCVSGGIDVQEIMRSRSTHLLNRLGGFEGRALRKDDVLHVRGSSSRAKDFIGKRVREDAIPDYTSLAQLRVVLGPEEDCFQKESMETFFSSEYIVAESSDRVGLRLQGPVMKPSRTADILSEGVTTGAIQVPANGLPIVLFVEHPTTGGYPKIANVITVDLHRVGQLKPRDKVRFQQVSLDEAVEALRAQERLVSTESIV